MINISLRELYQDTTVIFMHKWWFWRSPSQFLALWNPFEPSRIQHRMRGCLILHAGFPNSCMSWLLEVLIWHYVVSCSYSVACWCIPVSHCPCVHSLFPLLLHPRPSSLPSTCRRSILTRWSSTSLWVHIPQHLIPSSPPQSPSPLSLSRCLSVPWKATAQSREVKIVRPWRHVSQQVWRA